ncbi:MAG: PAS domain-containing protein [Opitutaceae bacterium]|jgi:PAS domain S-box-containing protein
MDPLPKNLLPVGCPSHSLKATTLALNWRVMPAVDDMPGLAAALKSCPVSVAVIGPDWPQSDRDAATELILSHAAACALPADLDSGVIDAAIAAALAEHAHRVESLFFSRMLELFPDPIFYKDRCGRFLAANQAIARHFKVADPAVLIGRSDADFFAPEHAQQALADEEEIISTGRPIVAKLERETYEEGTPTWCLSWKSPLRDLTGRVIGIYGFSRDVTEFKTTEAALATERHLLEALLTGMPDSVFIKDREGRFLLANQVVANWMGSTPALLRGKRDTDFYPEDMAADFRRDEQEVMASGMPVVNREELVRTADGRELWVLTTKIPYRNPKGETVGVIGMSRNISIRKAFGEQLKGAQDEIAALRAELAKLKEAV